MRAASTECESQRCGRPVDDPAKQEHRPSRQARPQVRPTSRRNSKFIFDHVEASSWEKKLYYIYKHAKNVHFLNW